MPTYDYECTSCNHEFEVFQNISDTPLTKCPKCGKKLRRLIGGGLGIIFKGSGFYTTDYKKTSISSNSSSSNGKSDKNAKTQKKVEKKEKAQVKT